MSLQCGGDTGQVHRFPRTIVLALTACLALVAGCSGGKDAVDRTGGEFRFVQGNDPGTVIPDADRKSAPEVDGTLMDGSTWRLDSLRGKVVVLNFWASWCGPCRTETPDFDKVYKATKASGVEFVGISAKDRKPEAQAFVKRLNVSYPSLFDAAGKTVLRFRDLRVNAFPFTIVIDKDFRVAAVYPRPLTDTDIEPVVKRLAAGG